MEQLTIGQTYYASVEAYTANVDKFPKDGGTCHCDAYELKVEGHYDIKYAQVCKFNDMSLRKYRKGEVINFIVKAFSKNQYTISLTYDKKDIVKPPSGSSTNVQYNPLPTAALNAAVKFHGDIPKIPQETEVWEQEVLNIAAKFLDFLKNNQ